MPTKSRAQNFYGSRSLAWAREQEREEFVARGTVVTSNCNV